MTHGDLSADQYEVIYEGRSHVAVKEPTTFRVNRREYAHDFHLARVSPAGDVTAHPAHEAMAETFEEWVPISGRHWRSTSLMFSLGASVDTFDRVHHNGYNQEMARELNEVYQPVASQVIIGR